MTLDSLTSDTFAPLLNDTFQLSSDEHTLSVTLIDVERRRSRSTAHREPFSVVFRGPHAPVWPQRIYRLSHPGLGELDIFFVPIGPDQLGLRYEAVFG